jgi:hypothetical protein
VAVFSKSNMSWMTEPRKPHVSGLSRRLPTSETSSSNTSGDGGFTQAQSKGHSTDPTSTGKKVLGKVFFHCVGERAVETDGSEAKAGSWWWHGEEILRPSTVRVRAGSGSVVDRKCSPRDVGRSERVA